MSLNLFDHSVPVRAGLLLSCYAIELTASLWLAYEFRFDFVLDPKFEQERLVVLLWFVPFQLVLLALFHQLTPLLGYFSTPDLARAFHALAISAAIALGIWWFLGSGFAPPRGVIAVDFVFSLVGLTGVHLSLRSARERMFTTRNGEHRRARRVGIIGAGDAGALLAHELALKPGLGLYPVAFFDDDRRKWRSRMLDIPVLGAPEMLREANGKLNIREAIIAMPSAPAKRIGEIVRLLRQAHIEFRTIPSIDQLALGQIKVSRLRKVEVQDLLGRDRIELEMESIRQVLRGRVILVTGAGGSIGSELCRQIATYHPGKLLLLDRSEPHVFQIEQELLGLGYQNSIVPLVGDILDQSRMEQVFSEFHPQLVFHAAAHKHVPMMEHQPGEAVKNNSVGTTQVAELALEFGVQRFVLISTDKAINPTSVMGATKRLAEMYVQALAAASGHTTKFIAVRFGNVLGSSGSVIPVFRRQIAEGGPVTVTHPRMTRYFMTIPEASMLVLQSAAQGDGGEIFVLDMGNPVKIVDLARQMIELSGLKPDEDIQIEFTGIRPGEKLFEELSYKGEDFVPTAHPKIRRFISKPRELTRLRQNLHKLCLNLHRLDPEDLKLMLRELVPEYAPFLDPGDTPLPLVPQFTPSAAQEMQS